METIGAFVAGFAQIKYLGMAGIAIVALLVCLGRMRNDRHSSRDIF
jgi:hypothetical protein